MPRVLFVSSPGLGHLNPMLPLAAGLQARGWDVRFAVGPDEVDGLRAAGLQADAAGLGEKERWPLVAKLAGPEFVGPDGRPTAKATEGRIFGILFGRVGAGARASDLWRIADDWRPDLFVHDLSEFASAPIARHMGVPHVTHSWAGFLPNHAIAAAAREAAPLWAARGLDAPADGGVFEHRYLVIYPASLRRAAPRPEVVREMRPAPPPVEAAAPAWLESTEGAIYLTLGTIFNDASALRAMAGAVAGLGRPVVATTGRAAGEALGEAPAGVRFEPYIPQEYVLARASVVVSHGGAGSFLGAVRHGLPQVVVPRGADQRQNAEAAVAAGIGLMLEPATLATDASVLTAAVERALGDSTLQARAQAVRAEIAAMPAVDSVAADLEELAARRLASPN